MLRGVTWGCDKTAKMGTENVIMVILALVESLEADSVA